ncbi:hypothetical protein ACJJTC_018727 [Scirpophaga incertulas]
MEEYKKLFESRYKLNSLVSCTLTNVGDEKIRSLTINNSYINPESTNGLHMMSGTYLYTNPPPYGYGSLGPYVAETVNRAHEYNRKDNKDSITKLNGFDIIDTQILNISEFPKSGYSRGKVASKMKFVRKLKMRVKVSQTKFIIKTKVIKGNKEVTKWLDDYARSFCSYIKHAERGKKDRRGDCIRDELRSSQCCCDGAHTLLRCDIVPRRKAGVAYNALFRCDDATQRTNGASLLGGNQA